MKASFTLLMKDVRRLGDIVRIPLLEVKTMLPSLHPIQTTGILSTTSTLLTNQQTKILKSLFILILKNLRILSIFGKLRLKVAPELYKRVLPNCLFSSIVIWTQS